MTQPITGICMIPTDHQRERHARHKKVTLLGRCAMLAGLLLVVGCQHRVVNQTHSGCCGPNCGTCRALFRTPCETSESAHGFHQTRWRNWPWTESFSATEAYPIGDPYSVSDEGPETIYEIDDTTEAVPDALPTPAEPPAPEVGTEHTLNEFAEPIEPAGFMSLDAIESLDGAFGESDRLPTEVPFEPLAAPSGFTPADEYLPEPSSPPVSSASLHHRRFPTTRRMSAAGR